jgi:hypothetical protein
MAKTDSTVNEPRTAAATPTTQRLEVASRRDPPAAIRTSKSWRSTTMRWPMFIRALFRRVAPLALVMIPFVIAACGKGSSGY